jgi:hypothetical protein
LVSNQKFATKPSVVEVLLQKTPAVAIVENLILPPTKDHRSNAAKPAVGLTR